MNKKRILASLCIGVLMFEMVGCKDSDSSLSNNKTTTLNYTINADESEAKYSIDSLEFDLGKQSFLEESGKSITYNISGSMAVPKDDLKHPVVIVAHGSHGGSSSDRFDTGFMYLLESIAKQGYVAISLNVQSQFTLDNGEPQYIERIDSIYRSHISKLADANSGKDVGYGIDLKGKLDLDTKVLIGHSRSGQDLMVLADRLIGEGDTSIKGVISLAPAQTLHISKLENDGIPPSKEFYPDVPIGIIVPEYDGDVASLDGFSIYDRILKEDKERKSPISLVMLKGGKHNYFNTLLKEDNMFLEQDIVIENKLDADSHRDFFVNYTKDFLDAVCKDDVKDTIFDNEAPSPNKMYGYDVLTKLSVPSLKTLDLTSDVNVFKGENADIVETVDHWIPDNDKIGPFRDPRLLDEIGLYSISFSDKNASVSVDVSKSGGFDGFSSLSFLVTQDPTNEANSSGENQGFTIVLKDKSGASSSVVVDKSNTVMKFVKGKVVSTPVSADSTYSFYSNYTPVGEIRVPLSYFEGVDLGKVSEIFIVFDQTDCGNIVVENISAK